MKDPFIRIRNLSKRFETHQVLDNLNLDVEQGETVAILGRSGMGKSVLLKHIIGLSKPDDGSIEVAGTEIANLSGGDLYKAIQKMGMLFQGAALFDSMTIEENTAFFLTEHPSSLSQIEVKERVSHALNMVGLAGTEKRKPSELSGGMLKRAAIARLLVYRPSILLYDEPTSGLDPMTTLQIDNLILQTQKELNATSIVVTHNFSSALYICDRVALLDQGKIIHIDKPEAFLKIDHPVINFLRETMNQDPRTLRAQYNHG